MVLMTTRSSRFFVVLLHLVGVSTHLPSSFHQTGIVGVNTFTIVLEHSDPSLLLLNNNDALYLQPHWLQDTSDHTCLGPMGGFSECGDATLWLVIPKQRRHARRRQWARWAIEDSDAEEEDTRPLGYALQLVDDPSNFPHSNAQTDARESSSSSPSMSSIYQDHSQRECLTRRRKDNQLVLAPCSQDRAWSWQFNEHGILHFEKRTARSSSSSRKKHRSLKRRQLECVGRNVTSAVLRSCDGGVPEYVHAAVGGISGSGTAHVGDTKQPSERTVQIALVRQATASSVDEKPSSAEHNPSLSSDNSEQELPEHTPGRKTQMGQVSEKPTADPDIPVQIANVFSDHLPSQRDIAHSHASEPAVHAELKSASRLTSISSNSNKAAADLAGSPRASSEQPPLHFLKNTNPILLASDLELAPDDSSTSTTTTSSFTSSNSEISSNAKVLSAKSIKSLRNDHHPPSSSTLSSSTTFAAGSSGPIGSNSDPKMKPSVQKIRVHPYIAASKNERWTDPKTGLVYPTDLCQYLGHDRSSAGRHTLMGVGHYMKTVFNIKVYGIALYVSKRDVLADAVMENYARYTDEELREIPDFYTVLRTMAATAKEPKMAGTFDRTLLLKINMQLGVDTMRSSLEADWKMLTQKDKDLLIGSSMKPRPASKTMLDIIQSDENPSRCSCGQIAPEEYQADDTCCARGTELVFTWRKNGDLEVRLNGVLMDSWNRPDIAAGIFFEYLRLDNPMSLDFLERAVDGFPFLLAPLAQVKGFVSPMSAAQASATSSKSSKMNPLAKALGSFGDAVGTHANSFAGFVQNGANEISNNAMNTVRNMGDAAQKLSEEMDRRRGLIAKHVGTFAHQTMSTFYLGRDSKALTVALPERLVDGMSDYHRILSGGAYFEANAAGPDDPRGNPSKNTILLRLLGQEPAPAAPDEIVPMIHPSTNSTQRFFFGMVHLYLLLMLIVSFPTKLATRTKLRIIRRGSNNSSASAQDIISDSESDISSSGLSAERTARKSLSDDDDKNNNSSSSRNGGDGNGQNRLKRSGSSSRFRTFRTLAR